MSNCFQASERGHSREMEQHVQMPGGPGQGAASRAEAEGLESAGPRSLDVVWGNGKPLEHQRQRSVRFK